MEFQNPNLNRSFSEPDILISNKPAYRRVVVQEIVQLPNQDRTLIRRFSCSEFIGQFHSERDGLTQSKLHEYCSEFDINTSSRTYNNKKLQINSLPLIYQNSLKLNNPAEEESTGKFNTEGPMEIDDDYDEYQEHTNQNIHSRSIGSANYDHCDNTTKTARRLNNTPPIPKEKSNRSKLNFCVCFTIIPIVIASLCIPLYFYIWQEDGLDDARQMFPSIEKLLYQDHVKRITLRSLYEFHQTKSKIILVFVGTTGVGKTYTVNLVKKYFPDEEISNVNFVLQPHINSIDQFDSNICDFVIIDDLRIDNLEDVISYITKLPDKCIFIIPIFNIHDVDDNMKYTMNKNHYETIKYKFESKFPSIANIVLFNNINRRTLEEWLKDELKKRDISDEDDAIYSLLDSHDIEVYGFKGLVSKINVLGL